MAGGWGVCVCVYLGYQRHEVMSGRDTQFQPMISPLGSEAESGVELRKGRAQRVHIIHCCSLW